MTGGAPGFSRGIGNWAGRAEVYDAGGRFLGLGRDRRHVSRAAASGKVRIDVSFSGPFRLEGHYEVDDRGSHRIYRGPANVGFAEVLSPSLVDANGYWPDAGLTQRFFMLVLPDGEKQLSLALMSRGEQPLYCVVVENDRLPESATAAEAPGVAARATDAPEPELLLHRLGRWRGSLSVSGRQLERPYEEKIEGMDDGLRVSFEGGFYAPEPVTVELKTRDQQAWSGPGELVGSYSLFGGRALAGTFHRTSRELRLWRREVATRDGTRKAVLHHWYRGQERVGTEYGVLELEPA